MDTAFLLWKEVLLWRREFQYRTEQMETDYLVYFHQTLHTERTSILKVLLTQYMSPTGPNKYLRGITSTKADQLELGLLKVKIWKDCIEKSGKLNLRKEQALQNWKLICIKSKCTEIHVPNFNWISQKAAKKNPEKSILAKGINSCKSRSSISTSNLICIISWQIHIPNLKSISQKTREKRLEN